MKHLRAAADRDEANVLGAHAMVAQKSRHQHMQQAVPFFDADAASGQIVNAAQCGIG